MGMYSAGSGRASAEVESRQEEETVLACAGGLLRQVTPPPDPVCTLRPCAPQVCNCDCLPIIPIDLARCATCATEAAAIAGEPVPSLPPAPHVPAPACVLQACGHTLAVAQEIGSEDEAMSESRDSMDSSRSEQYGATPRWAAAAGGTVASALAAAPFL